MCVSTLVSTYQIFENALVQKLVGLSKRNFTSSFGALRLRDKILVEFEPEIKGG